MLVSDIRQSVKLIVLCNRWILALSWGCCSVVHCTVDWLACFHC